MTSTSTSDLLHRVRTVIDTQVRPGLQAEGSDVHLVGVDDDRIVQVRVLGACQSCANTTYQLLMWIESILKPRVPEVCFVEAVP